MLLALLNSASYLAGSKVVHVASTDLMAHAQPYYITPAYAFVAYPNRDSVPFREAYGLPEAETVVRGTLRYQGFPQFVGVLVTLGWLDSACKAWLTEGMTWGEVTQKAIGASGASEACVPVSVARAPVLTCPAAR